MGVEGILNKGFITASADTVLNYVRTGSLWPVTFGLACCAVFLHLLSHSWSTMMRTVR